MASTTASSTDRPRRAPGQLLARRPGPPLGLRAPRPLVWQCADRPRLSRSNPSHALSRRPDVAHGAGTSVRQAPRGANSSAYATQDPFAAIIVFQTGTVHQVSWALARDTLTEALNRPTGQGNVHVWPVGSGPDAELNLALSSPHGTAWLTAPLPVVAQWLGRTYHLVPVGQEVSGLDMDAELSRLLDGAA
ncbi:SsgA family sporulation/cell division regulator [Streptomyces sp. CB01373]|uniref:SsgA family sporulation/cell division regulator n=1 Tax=Streptomyces sp. CB01373 TaxID=2020325 RepID=UPI000C27023E|nr:hypothetical protein CG719_32075 [Streptomyces sp. CB01373]